VDVRKSLSRGLGKAGKALIEPILGEMAENAVVPDAIEAVALRQAATLVDRQAEFAEIVERDGLLLETPTGQVKTHPAAAPGIVTTIWGCGSGRPPRAPAPRGRFLGSPAESRERGVHTFARWGCGATPRHAFLPRREVG
jgi:hypothetical protein